MSRSFALAASAFVLVSFAPVAAASPIVYSATLSGPAEAPPNASPGTGLAVVTFDPVAHTLRVQVTFSGLIGNTTASHIHSATVVPGVGNAGVATQVPNFVGFPLGVTSGTYDNTFNTSLLSTYNPAFVAANGGTAASAEAALAFGLSSGRAYLNVHSTAFPGGEIRGFLVPVPEPTTLAAFGLMGVCGLAARRRAAVR